MIALGRFAVVAMLALTLVSGAFARAPRHSARPAVRHARKVQATRRPANKQEAKRFRANKRQAHKPVQTRRAARPARHRSF